MTPAEVTRLLQDPYATGQVALTPDQIRQGYNRTALAKAPAALADIAQLPAAVGLNVLGAGARGINYLFGTELPEKSFSLTPFYDRYVRQPEQELATGVRTLPPKPEAPAVRRMTPAEVARLKQDPYATGTSTQPTKAALSYDNKVTPYDALMAQSAAQYGIDPVVFKRLIGTESSFRPDPGVVIGANGQRHIGIAQISDRHGLSDADRRNPAIAIPFAAQLLAKEIQKTGGNVEEALMNYKGASSPGGRAAMSKPIGDILSGLTPSATPATAAAAPGAAPAAAAPAAAAPAPVRSEADFYLANPQSIPMDMQRAIQQRGEVERLMNMYRQAGLGPQFMEARAKLMELDNGMTYLQGMQGLQEFTLANDPRRLAAVWSQYAGVPIGIQPRTDGKFDIIVNGRKTKEGQTAREVTDAARSGFDGTYRQQQSAALAKANEERFKSQLKMQEEYAKQQAEMIKNIYVEQAKGNIQLAVEQLKMMRYDVKPSGANDGTVIITPPGSNAPFVFNPSGRTIEVDGVKITSNAAYPIAGLPTYGGVQMTR
jgi:soluble lytic murein transglycosylase-like protein